MHKLLVLLFIIFQLCCQDSYTVLHLGRNVIINLIPLVGFLNKDILGALYESLLND